MLTAFKQHKWKTAVPVFIIALILLLPYILQYAVKTAILDYTKPYGIEQVNLSDLSLNLFKGTVSIHHLELYKKTGNSNQPAAKSVIHINELGVDLDWLPLFKKHIAIQSLTFNDANFPFKLDNENRLFLANIPLFSDKETTPEDSSDSSDSSGNSFLPGLNNIKLNNIHLSL